MSKDKTTLIYTAGIFDGEGYISIMKKLSIAFYKRVPFYATAVIKVASVDRRMTDYLYDKFGGYLHQRKAQKLHHSDSWCWEMKGNSRVLELLKSVYPYLIVKKENAKAVMDFVKYRIKIKNTGKHRGCVPTTKEVYIKMDNYIKLARSYTKKGKYPGKRHRNATLPAETK